MLVFVPVAFVLQFAHVEASWIFVASGIAIIPLAGILGEATEHLAEHVGPGIGGLLNATFDTAAVEYCGTCGAGSVILSAQYP